jgi:hypothetical protein
MDGKDPFGYPVITYLAVIGLACFGGVVKYLNTATEFKLGRLFIDVVTSALAGLMTFYMCNFLGITGSLSAVLIATSGLLGNRCFKTFENIWLDKVGGRLNNQNTESNKEV